MRIHPVFLLFILPALCLSAPQLGAEANPDLTSRIFIEPFSGQLSSNDIHCMVQDTTGFLWVGTTHGLNKIDGNMVRTYLHDPQDECSLADDYIQGLHVSSDGTLWVLVPMYLCRYDEEKDRFTAYPYASEKRNAHSSNIHPIVEDDRGDLWIGTPDTGLFHFNTKTLSIRRVEIPLHSINNIVYRKDRRELWVFGYGEIDQISTEQDRLVRHLLPGESPLGLDFRHRIVLCAEGIYAERMAEDPAHPFLPAPDTGLEAYFKTCFLNASELFFIGTRGNGLIVTDKMSDHNKILTMDPDSRNAISNDNIICMLEDRTGTIWIGTRDGLDRCSIRRDHFRSLTQKDGLASGITKTVYWDREGTLWAGGFDGISRKADAEVSFRPILNVVCDGEVRHCFDVRDIVEDGDGDLWIAKKDELLVLDRKDGRYHSLRLPYKREGNPDVLCLCAGKDSVLWAGSYGNGLFKVDAASRMLLSHMEQDNSFLSSNYIKDILALDDSTICLATLRAGIDIMDTRTGRIRNIRFQPVTGTDGSNSINCVFKDSEGRIWALTWAGCFVLGPDFEIQRVYRQADGFRSDEFTAIGEDADKDIWIGTGNGLSRLSQESGQVRIHTYSTADGLISNNIETGAILMHGRETYVGTSSGIVAFKIDDISRSTPGTKPVLTTLRIQNEEVRPGEKIGGTVILDRQIHLTDKIRLKHRHKNFTLEFSAMDFRQGGKTPFRYKLEGLDKDWLYTSESYHSASYNNLRRGNYLFRVSAGDRDGGWSEERVLGIHVSHPAWMSGWAFLLYLSSIVGILYLITRFFVSREKLKQELALKQLSFEKENELRDMKIDFFTRLSHDLRTPLTLIINPVGRLIRKRDLDEKDRKQLETVQTNAGYLLSLVNQLLDFQKMEIHGETMQVCSQDLVTFTQEIIRSFSSWAIQKEISLEYTGSTEPIPVFFDPEMIGKVLYNLLGNALKFTNRGGRVTVAVSQTPEAAVVSVSDTGIGIDEKHREKIFEDFYRVPSAAPGDEPVPGSGIGLSIVKKYISLHHGQIKVESQPGIGSTFTFLLKKGQEHFEASQFRNEEVPVPSGPPVFVPAHPAVRKKAPDVNPAPADTDRRSIILVVEDNPELSALLQDILEPDYRVLSAPDGKQALDLAREKLPDLILSDIMMPAMDGLEMARILKGDMMTSHIPILFLTAKVSRSDMRSGLETGAYDYVTKPFEEDFLRSKIDNILKDRKAFARKMAAPEEIQAEDPFLKKVKDFIKTHITESELGSKMIEEHFHVTRMQVYRKLRAVCDRSLTDLIREERIRKAKELMRTTDLNVSQIAYDLGFSDPFYFSKVFKKETGESPVSYKKRIMPYLHD